MEGRTVVVAGTTDLPDGVYLLWDAHLVGTIDPIVHNQGEMQVADGRFEKHVDVSGWPAGEIDVWVGFELYGDSDYQQPREVVERFGSEGQKLTGSNVEDMGEFRRVTDLVRLRLP